jgi:hypothetical protein
VVIEQAIVIWQQMSIAERSSYGIAVFVIFALACLVSYAIDEMLKMAELRAKEKRSNKFRWWWGS